ncbi:MAG: YwiC-like family protein, partial [Chloroflexota bacterium]|nr:YwiC-like family protein [Chloroflexota bacterium]
RLSGWMLPREHGAWAMLIVPLIVGVGAGGKWNPDLLPLALTVFGFFLLRYPLMLAIKSRAPDARRDALRWSALFAALTATSGAWLLLAAPLLPLIAIGALGLASLLIYLGLAARRAEMSTVGEWMGIAGLALSAPGAYLVATRALDSTAIALYLLNALYFGGTVLYIKYKVRVQPRAVSPTARWTERLWAGRGAVAYHALLLVLGALLALVGTLPALAAAAFALPMCQVLGGVVSRPVRLNIPRLGFVELTVTTVFALVVLAAYR